MKKIIICLVVGSLFCVQMVYAQKFKETSLFTSYNLKVKGKQDTYESIDRLVKVEDGEQKAYYSINPRHLFYFSKDYTLEKVDVPVETMQEISKYIYFGYGYKNQNTDKFYVATQYLVYTAFKENTVFLSDSYGQPINAFENEVQQIEANIENTTFAFENQKTSSLEIEITDAYILNNFEIKGEHIKVVKSATKITIELLDQLEEYTLQFIPKIDCSNVNMWQTEGLKYIHMEEVCENTYTRTIQLEKKVEDQPPKQEEEKEKEETETEAQPEEKKEIVSVEQKDTSVKKEEKKQKETAEKNAEMIVHVPNTKKNSISLLVFFGLLGNFYYVVKK